MLGLMLAVKTSLGGDQLMFRYPPVVRRQLTQETLSRLQPQRASTPASHTSSASVPSLASRFAREAPISAASEQSLASSGGSSGSVGSAGGSGVVGGAGGAGAGGSSSTTVPTMGSGVRASTQQDPYQMSSVILAHVLIPKRSLCNEPFSMTIGDTSFFGYPKVLSNPTNDSAPSSNVAAAAAATAPSAAAAAATSSSAQQQQQQITSATPPGVSVISASPSSSLLGSGESVTAAASSSVSLSASSVSFDVNLDGSTRSSTGGLKTLANKDELLIFSITFVTLQSDDEQESHYHQLSKMLAGALEFEEWRSGYLSNQVAKMHMIREKWLAQQSNADRPDHRQLTQDILKVSILANELRIMYHNLVTTGVASFRINQTVIFGYTVNSHPLYHPTKPIRPYQTLLLLHDPKRVIENASANSISPIFIRFIDSIHPTKSFQTMHMETGIPIAHIYMMAANLLHWGMARIIEKLVTNNIYVLNPSIESLPTRNLSERLNKRFPSHTLSKEIDRFSQLRTLGEHLPDASNPQAQREFIELVSWLLREDIIVQVFQYPYLLLSHVQSILDERDEQYDESGGAYDYSTTGSYRGNGDNENDMRTRWLESGGAPEQLTHAERAALSRYNDGSEDFALLERLAPYFRGQHHISEIMWRENVTRSDLSRILSTYSSIIVVCVHQDGTDKWRRGS